MNDLDMATRRQLQHVANCRGMDWMDSARPQWVDDELQAEQQARVDAIVDAINCHTPPTFMEFAEDVLERWIDAPTLAALIAAVVYPKPATDDAPSSQDAARSICERWIQRYAEERA